MSYTLEIYYRTEGHEMGACFVFYSAATIDAAKDKLKSAVLNADKLVTLKSEDSRFELTIVVAHIKAWTEKFRR